MKGPFDVLIQGGVVVTGGGMARADVGVRGEKIVAVSPGLVSQDAERVIDATSKLVLPGMIDVHSHPVYLDDIHHTSITAAHGGVTTSIHYAYARPGMSVLDTIRQFRDDGLEHSLADFGLHVGLFDVPNQIDEIPEAFELGVASFKMFMTYAKLHWMTDDYWLTAALDVIGQEGGLAMVHAENGLATDYLEDKYTAMELSGPEVFIRSRPAVLEAEAVNRLIAIAQAVGCAVYVPHISTGAVFAPIQRARASGQVVYAETCPHYLVLTEDAIQKWGPRAKGGPPLRTADERERLWQGVHDRTIDVVASDHLPKGKYLNDNFAEAPFSSGPQVETLLTTTYEAGVNSGRISVPRVVQLLSETPAKIFGYYPKKGTIAPRSDADLVIFDSSAPFTIQHADLHSRGKYTLYEGMECLGKPVMVMQRGRLLIDDGELVAEPGSAQYLPTHPAVIGV